MPATVYIGRYEARATPVADTDPATARGATVKLVAGTYDVLVRAPGYGLRRFTLTVKRGPGAHADSFALTPNVASKSQGASAAGAGTNHDSLIDDTESTTWDVTGATGVNVAQPSVTISLAGAKPVRTIAVSALLDPSDPDGDEGRFTALRRFKVETCDGRTANCSLPTSWQALYTSPADAFPAIAPRPLAPDLTLRTFDVPNTVATQVRFTALENQCTGAPGLPGRAGQRPAERHGLRHRLRQGHVPARGRVRGVRPGHHRLTRLRAGLGPALAHTGSPRSTAASRSASGAISAATSMRGRAFERARRELLRLARGRARAPTRARSRPARRRR